MLINKTLASFLNTLLIVNESKRSNRNLNFEILRVFAMYMIVVLHFYTAGLKVYNPVEAIYFSTEGTGLVNFIVSQTLLPFVSIGVNLYVLISGYFLINTPPQKKVKIR